MWHRNQRDIRGPKASAKIQQSLGVCDQNNEVALRCGGYYSGKELKTVGSRPLVNPVDYVQIEPYARTLNKAPVFLAHFSCYFTHPWETFKRAPLLKSISGKNGPNARNHIRYS
jgi:hypothetical protein